MKKGRKANTKRCTCGDRKSCHAIAVDATGEFRSYCKHTDCQCNAYTRML